MIDGIYVRELIRFDHSGREITEEDTLLVRKETGWYFNFKRINEDFISILEGSRKGWPISTHEKTNFKLTIPKELLKW